MVKPRVSVIIPVYNTEQFIEQTLRSIMEQSLREVEIIVVDDGSTDGSLAVIESMAAKESRIKVISQPNKGLSEARNAGLEQARGQFVHFMDSDDLLEADTYQVCYARCEKDALDLVIFDADCFGAITPDAFWYDYHRARYIGEQTLTGHAMMELLLDAGRYRASACMSFIRRSYLDAHALRFEPGILHEDELFTPQLYLGAARTGAIERDFFHRRVREGSIMGVRFSERRLEGYMAVVNGLERYAQHRSTNDKRLIARLLRLILVPVMHNAAILRPATRWRLAWILLRDFPGSIGAKQLFLLLFKAPIKRLLR